MKKGNRGVLLSRALFLIVPMFFLLAPGLRAQELPPRPISVQFGQNLCFGALSVGGTGGTVSISTNGIRTATGNIVLFNQGYVYNPALFYVIGNPGTIIHVLNGPDAVLTGNHGGTLSVHLGSTSPGDPIILQQNYPTPTLVYLGGTLTVGSPLANPAGDYIGSFSLMFIQE
jgi:hypothetical protein